MIKARYLRKKYDNPTAVLKGMSVRGPGSNNPKKEIRKWLVSRIFK